MRQYACSDCHEKPASRIDRLEELRRHMCSEAVCRKGIKTDVCAACESPCAYGLKALRILGVQRQKETKPEPAIVKGEMLLTISQRISGYRKELSLNRYSKR